MSGRRPPRRDPSQGSALLRSLHAFLFISIFLVVGGILSWAAGINVPAGSTLRVNNGTLSVSGNVTNDGTLQTTTGTIALTGSWTNNATYQPGTGLIDLRGTAGTQDVTMGGVAQAFYNLQHSGASTARILTNPITITNNFANSAGTFNANNLNVTIAGSWTNTATFTPGTSSVIFNGTNQSLTGNTTFYNFNKTVAAADTLTFDNTAEQTVTHQLTLKGAAGQLLSLRSNTNNVQTNLTLQPGGTQVISYVDVKDNDASNGVTLVAGSTSTDSTNNINWLFGAAVVTWTGTVSTDWNDPFNWDLGFVPTAADSVVIPQPPANQPVLATDVSVANLTINSGSLTLNGKNLTVTTAFNNNGTGNVNLFGTETLTITMDNDSGTFTYVGDGNGSSDNRTINNFGGAGYFNLVINDSHATKDNFLTAANLAVHGSLTVTSGVMDISTNTNTLTVTGTTGVNGANGTLTATNGNITTASVDISNGIFTAPTAGKTFDVSGDFTHSGGTFTNSSGLVTLNGTNQHLNGNTTFYDLTKTVAAADTLTFDNTANQTVTHHLTLQGAVGQLLSLRSDLNGTQANLTLQAGGLQTLSYLNVKDNDASSGLTLVAGGTSVDAPPGGTNTNWVFGGATITWTGTVDTDWDKPGNWDLGFVPTVGDTVIIPAAPPNQPVLSTSVTVAALTINSGTLSLNGKDLTVSGAFNNNGTGNVKLFGNENVTLTMDNDSGTFTYVGNGDGTVDTRTLKDFSGSGYFNLVINDANATKDIFQSNATINVHGDLTVTSGTMDTSTNSNALNVTGGLTVNGATGTLTTTNSDVVVTGNVSVSNGVFTAPTGGKTFDVAGNFSHLGGTFTNSSGRVTLNGNDQSLFGNTTFYDLTKAVTVTHTLTFDNTATQTVTHDLVLTGNGAGNRLFIVSDVAGQQANLTLQAGATQTISDVDVKDNDASGGLLLVARGSSHDSLNNLNWAFGGVTITWDGSTSTAWNTASNWDLGLVPGPLDNVIIATAANQPVMSTAVSINNLTMNVGGTTLDMNGNNLAIAGTLSNDGNISLFGSENLTIGTIDPDTGTFTFTGNGDGVPDVFILPDFGGTDFVNVVINDTHAVKDTFRTNNNLTLAGTLTVTSGTLDISTNANTLTAAGITVNGANGTLTATNGNITDTGSFTLSAGTVTAPTTGKTFDVASSWTNTGGTFNNSNGNVTFNTANPVVITGNTTFYDFTSTVPGKSFTFTAGSTQTVDHTFDVQGTSASKIILHSSAGGSKWDVTFPNGTQSVFGADVQDSNANSNIVNCLNCADNGNNNVNWVFQNFRISAPLDGRTVGQTPTILGNALPNSNIEIKETGGSVVATARVDANGNFRVVLGQDQASLGTVTMVSLPLGAESLTPYLGASPGDTNNITVVASPTTAQVPTILTPPNNSRINGDKPTFTGQGKAGFAVTVYANDANGNLLLTAVGTGAVDGSGNYSNTITTSLVKGANYVSVVVDGVSSDLNTYKLTDPWGIVFDSTTNQPIKNAVVTMFRQAGTPAVPGVDLDASDVNPVTTGVDGMFSFIAANGNYYMTVQATGYDYPSVLTTFPPGRVIVPGSKGETYAVAGVIIQMDQPMDGNGLLLRIEKTANKKEAKVGDVVTYTITMQNISADNSVFNITMSDQIPPGFKYLPGHVIMDDVPIADPTGTRPLEFNVGNFAPSQTKTLKYQLVVGAGVTQGKYENVALAKYATGFAVSNRASATVSIIMDPLFDLGTIIGKVFFDLNENGIQDPPTYDATEMQTIEEKPVPNVQLMMEDGTVVTSDAEGKFSLPGLLPGRHLLRVDESTLPQGAYLTTDKVVIVDLTPGIMAKVNFGVNLGEGGAVGRDTDFFGTNVQLIQDRNHPTPRLNCSLFNEQVLMFNGTLLEQAEFRIFTNFSPFIEKWTLSIYDQDTKRVVRTIEGSRFNIHDPIYWDGHDNGGEMIREDRKYSYVLSVSDAKGRTDETKEKPIAFKIVEDLEKFKQEKESLEDRAKRYTKWVEAERQVNNMGKQLIPVDGETFVLNPKDTALQAVRIMHGNKLVAEVPVGEYHGLTPQEILATNSLQQQQQPVEVILPKGDYTFEVLTSETPVGGAKAMAVTGAGTARAPAGTVELASIPLNKHSKEVKVGEDYFTFVALGDGKVGYNINRGNIEPVQSSDQFQKGLWAQGKMAYFLKGKVLGKYLVTSSFDTDREQKEFFRNLDQNTYYPVYGDSSSKNYQATETQGPLYLLVQWDQSQAIWGNYVVDLGESNEFAKFSRTLYGGKIDYKDVATNKFGDPRTRLIMFSARVKQRTAHNEFLATGGSLYYLKHRGIIEGSDKIRVEIRDQVTGLVKSSNELKRGVDYEIDQDQGRILFWRPVAMLAQGTSIISDNLLAGNPAYVVADYAYTVTSKIDMGTEGVEMQQAVGGNVVVGGTYVKEAKDASDYQLAGMNATVHLAPDATIKAEYASTRAEDNPTYISTDGGITFTQIATSAGAHGEAYGITGDARLFQRFGLTSYYKWIGPDFSTADTTSQQGKQLTGLALTWDVTPETRLTASQDIQKLLSSGNLQTQLQVGGSQTTTTLMQIVHQAQRLKLTGEYRLVETRQPNQFTGTATTENTLAARADYVLTDRIDVALQHQEALTGPKDQATTVGAAARLTDHLSLTAEEAFGTKGLATKIGAVSRVNDRIALTGDYTWSFDANGNLQKITTIGAETSVSDKLALKSQVALTEATGGIKTTAVTLASNAKVNETTQMQTGVTITQSSNAPTSVTLGNTSNSSTGGTGTQTGVNVSSGPQTTAAATFGGTTQLDQQTAVSGTVSVGQDQTTGALAKSYAVGASKKLDEKTETSSTVQVDELAQGGQTTTVTVADKRKLTDELQAVTERSFGTSTTSELKQSNKYAIVRDKNGHQIQGSIERVLANNPNEYSQSNIFGLSGELNDRWAVLASYERGIVKNLDATQTTRNAIALGAGYVRKDLETGVERLKSSTKVELRTDKGAEDHRQYVLYNATEGRPTDQLTLFEKIELSETRNTTTNLREADYKEIILGAAYRPVSMDRLNLIGRYTFKQDHGPQGQIDQAGIDQTELQVFSVDAIYDMTEKWQLAEKFAYRLSQEKVTGFEFTRTHTWLMIHRLNYRPDRNWQVSGEYRMLRQQEAKDKKQGFLFEVSRNINEFTQLGVGYNFTDFSDDLTNLSYTSQGPFLRVTAKLYDRTPAERQRARAKWLEERVTKWAWTMVNNELAKSDSKIVRELNYLYAMAQVADQMGRYQESKQIYRDIITAGQMMFDEAAEYIREQIAFEEQLVDYDKQAAEYFRSGELIKARQLWERIINDAQKTIKK